ncbi:MAG: WXG100 family type VII secretion target [Pseudonocardiales bacterium]|nr:MAG: WXG100 family type VII secretion target [Pseudonocardiales bacterium]
MSDQIQVSWPALEAASIDIANTSVSLNQKLGDLKQFIAPMVAEWSGDAQVHYAAKQREWDTAAADLNTILAQIGKAVELAKQDFMDGERNNAQIWI